ncbi:MAG: single-stranded DNA-binding protein [Candidatus Choladocola sp.]|nr:single-stranded DNA-binding protein [Candidatus Choladocola sp.]
MVNNKVILIGRVTKDAQIVEPKEEGQKKITHFNLAVDKMRKKSGADGANSEESTAYFFRCTAFGRQAGFMETYGKKGVKFAVEGHLATGGYDKDGVHIPTVEIIVENIQFCERKNGEGAGGDSFLVIPDEMVAEMPFQ